MFLTATGDDRGDPGRSGLGAVLVVVTPAAGADLIRPPALRAGGQSSEHAQGHQAGVVFGVRGTQGPQGRLDGKLRVGDAAHRGR